MPIVGFTWYSLPDQVDWNIALRENNSRGNPLGLYDLNRHIRPAAVAYRHLIRVPRPAVPTQVLSPRPAEVPTPAWTRCRSPPTGLKNQSKNKLPRPLRLRAWRRPRPAASARYPFLFSF